MIIDELKNSECYGNMGERFAAGFAFLKNTDLKAIAPGRYEIDGDRLYASVEEYQTRPVADDSWEAHRRYADIQYVITGSEVIGWAPLHTLDVREEYDDAKDIGWFQGKGTFLPLEEGRFMVLFPQDAHEPGRTAGETGSVKKIVVKVLLD